VFFGLADFLVGICHARVRDGGTSPPDTLTCPKKNAAREPIGLNQRRCVLQPTP